MKIIQERIKQATDFMRFFDEAWRSPTLPKHPRVDVQNRLLSIDSSLNDKEIASELFNLEKAGVIYASDLLTYIFTSRLSISLSEKINDPKSLRKIYKFWLNFVNYLLITNVFEPNKDIDTKDLGTGKYEDIQLKVRKSIVREIFLKLLDLIPALEIFEVIANHGRAGGDALTKDQIKDIGRELGLSEENMRCNKTELIEVIKSTDERKLSKWIKNISEDHQIWQGLAGEYMPYSTPGFLIKNVGLASELFVLLKLINEDVGYIIPTLLNQRLYSRLRMACAGAQEPIDKYVLFPPDFLLAREGKIIGIELGRGKPELISSFAAVSGLPTVFINAVIRNPSLKLERDFGYKCNLCFLSFTVCKKYIELFPERLDEFDGKSCSKLCDPKRARECLDSAVRCGLPSGEGNVETVVHYQCLNECHPNLAKEINTNKIFPLYPEISGLEKLKIGLRY